MSRLWIGNFDFEFSLVNPAGSLPEKLRRLNAELALVWLAVARPDDCIVCPLRPEDAFLERLSAEIGPLPRLVSSIADAPGGMTPVPWGWSERVVRELAQAGCDAVVEPGEGRPAVEVVRVVNSRRFSVALEESLGCGLLAAGLAETPREVKQRLRAIVRSGSERWVIKAELGNSARERILGTGAELTASQVRWLESRLERDGSIAVEPWVERVDEMGVQWEVPRTGVPHLVGITPLLTGIRGEYRGSRFCEETAVPGDWQSVVAVSREAAVRVQASGYFGPLGIDACRYRRPIGEIRVRPLQDVNARWTMGRLALGWRRLLAPGGDGVWWFQPVRDDMPASDEWRTVDVLPNRLAGGATTIRSRLQLDRRSGE